MTATIEQATMFSPARTSQDGRTLRSDMQVAGTLNDGAYIELEVSVSHRRGYGYHATVTRATADGFSRRMSLSGGPASDVTRLDIEAPNGARFNRAALDRFHLAAATHIEQNLNDWLDWAKGCKTYGN